MKKITLLLFSCLLAIGVFSQEAPTSFENMAALADFIKNDATLSQKKEAYVVEEPIVVTYVGESAYIQYANSDSSAISGLKFDLATGVEYEPKVGDAIIVKGVYTVEKYNSGQLSQVASFKAQEVELVESDRDLIYADINADEGFATPRISNVSSIVHMGGGNMVGDDENGYFLKVTLGANTDSISLVSVGDVDLSAYVGKIVNEQFEGIFTYSNGWVLYVVRMYDPVVYYDNIADLVENIDTLRLCGLNNAVLLSYIHRSTAATFLFVQDATGALYLQGDKNLELSVLPGDSIVNVKGWFDKNKNAPFLWITSSHIRVVDYLKHSDGEICGKEVSLADIVADFKSSKGNSLSEYANKVVILSGLKNKTPLSESASNKKFWMYQGEDSIQFNSYWWEKNGATIYDEIATLVGVVDYNGVTNGTTTLPVLTIMPLDAESVVEYTGEFPVVLDNVVMHDVYTSGRSIFANSEFDIFTITGQNVTNENGFLQKGVYIVKMSDKAVKLVIK